MVKEEVDPFSAHEALHASYMMMEIWTKFVADHPYVANDKFLSSIAEDILSNMNAFYQQVGARSI